MRILVVLIADCWLLITECWVLNYEDQILSDECYYKLACLYSYRSQVVCQKQKPQDDGWFFSVLHILSRENYCSWSSKRSHTLTASLYKDSRGVLHPLILSKVLILNILYFQFKTKWCYKYLGHGSAARPQLLPCA